MKAMRYFSAGASLTAKPVVSDDGTSLNPDDIEDDWRLKGSLSWPAGVDPFAPLPSSPENAAADSKGEKDGGGGCNDGGGDQSEAMEKAEEQDIDSIDRGNEQTPNAVDPMSDVDMAESSTIPGKRQRSKAGAAVSGLDKASSGVERGNDRDWKRLRLESGSGGECSDGLERRGEGETILESQIVEPIDSKVVVTCEKGERNKEREDKIFNFVTNDEDDDGDSDDLVKIIDYDDLYCEVCDKYFRNLEEKCAHDMSKAHRRRMVEQQQQDELEMHKVCEGEKDSSSDDNDETLKIGLPQPLPEEWGDALSRIDAFMAKEIHSVGEIEVPESFKSWAHKSMEAAMAQAGLEEDPTLLSFVRKEVTFELLRQRNQCTLFKLDWNRTALATGVTMKTGGVVLPMVAKGKSKRNGSDEQDAAQTKTEAEVDVKTEAKEEEEEEAVVKCETTIVKIEDCLVQI